MSFSIDNIKNKMLIKYPFFGSVIANVEIKEEKSIPTAGANLNTIYYNPDYLSSLSKDEQVFVFSHEVCHIAFNHILRSKEKDPYIWNIATDAVINAFLQNDGLKIVEGGIDMPDAINYDAEELYEKLYNEKNNNQSQQLNGNESNSNSSDLSTNQSDSNCNSQKEMKDNDVGHDTHSMWDDVIKENDEEQNKSLSDKDENNNQKMKQANEEIKKKQEEISSMGEKESFKKNKEEYKKQLKELRKELQEQSILQGNETSENIINISNIGQAKPLIDWRFVLRETITYDIDWSYKNATIEDGVVSANLEEIPIPETEIVLDTSGSIDETLLRNFLKECKNILQYSKVKVGCFDTKFYGFKEIRTEEDIEKMIFLGGGGTDFDVAVNSFSKRVENKIIFTDGYSDMPKNAINAIWIVFGRKKITPEGGKVIYIDYDKLNELQYKKDILIKKKIKS